jgi:hypothetical protein
VSIPDKYFMKGGDSAAKVILIYNPARRLHSP